MLHQACYDAMVDWLMGRGVSREAAGFSFTLARHVFIILTISLDEAPTSSSPHLIPHGKRAKNKHETDTYRSHSSYCIKVNIWLSSRVTLLSLAGCKHWLLIRYWHIVTVTVSVAWLDTTRNVLLQPPA